MTMTWRRFALPLVCLTGVCCMATLSIANGGIWDKHFRSRPSATPHRVPTPAELEIFFIDATADSPAS